MRRPESPTLRVLTFLAAIEGFGGSFRARDGKGLFGLDCQRMVYEVIHAMMRSSFIESEGYYSGRYRLTQKGMDALKDARKALEVVA